MSHKPRNPIDPTTVVPAPLPMNEKQAEEIQKVAHQLLSRVDSIEGLPDDLRQDLGYTLEKLMEHWGALKVHRRSPVSQRLQQVEAELADAHKKIAELESAAASAPEPANADGATMSIGDAEAVTTDAMPLVIVRPTGEHVAVDGSFTFASAVDFCRANGHCPDLAVQAMRAVTTLVSQWPKEPLDAPYVPDSTFKPVAESAASDDDGDGDPTAIEIATDDDTTKDAP